MNYRCQDCKHEFTSKETVSKCPSCHGENVEQKEAQKIPVFFGMNTNSEGDACVDGVCSFDKNKS